MPESGTTDRYCVACQRSHAGEVAVAVNDTCSMAVREDGYTRKPIPEELWDEERRPSRPTFPDAASTNDA